jgi:hypothetical protein
MYRYLVFAYYSQYPYGGMNDLVLKTNDVSEVKESWKENSTSYDFVEVYDCQTGRKYKDINDFVSEAE